MNKIPKCKTKKINPLKLDKRPNKESIKGKMKMKIVTNKSITRSFGQDITNFVKLKDIQKIPKKSSSCNNKVRQKYYYFK